MPTITNSSGTAASFDGRYPPPGDSSAAEPVDDLVHDDGPDVDDLLHHLEPEPGDGFVEWARDGGWTEPIVDLDAFAYHAQAGRAKACPKKVTWLIGAGVLKDGWRTCVDSDGRGSWTCPNHGVKRTGTLLDGLPAMLADERKPLGWLRTTDPKVVTRLDTYLSRLRQQDARRIRATGDEPGRLAARRDDGTICVLTTDWPEHGMDAYEEVLPEKGLKQTRQIGLASPGLMTGKAVTATGAWRGLDKKKPKPVSDAPKVKVKFLAPGHRGLEIIERAGVPYREDHYDLILEGQRLENVEYRAFGSVDDFATKVTKAAERLLGVERSRGRKGEE